MKGTQLLHGGFLLFNSTDFCEAGAAIEQRSQPLQLVCGADRVDLHPAVVFIAHPAAQAEIVRMLLDEPAESDTLYTSRNKPPAGLNQRADSPTPAAFGTPRTDSIASRRLFTVRGFGIRRNPCSTT